VDPVIPTEIPHNRLHKPTARPPQKSEKPKAHQQDRAPADPHTGVVVIWGVHVCYIASDLGGEDDRHDDTLSQSVQRRGVFARCLTVNGHHFTEDDTINH
jgi:hypothetical protein